jgi:hypothetical protein
MVSSLATRRKVSGGTPGELGRDCGDAFPGLAKTPAKLKISFWDSLIVAPGAFDRRSLTITALGSKPCAFDAGTQRASTDDQHGARLSMP